jgi:hypothetical protein
MKITDEDHEGGLPVSGVQQSSATRKKRLTPTRAIFARPHREAAVARDSIGRRARLCDLREDLRDLCG